MRRRVVSILADIPALQPDSPHVPDVCALLVGRVNDKDESIKACLKFGPLSCFPLSLPRRRNW